jgi:uncharacterized protein (TIGR02300 family)
MSTSTKARGLKRICQDDDCGLPFYDLNRSAFACPNCGVTFDVAAAAAAAAAKAEAMNRGYGRKSAVFAKPVAPVVVKEKVEDEVDAELVGDEVAEDASAEADADVILEEDDGTEPIAEIEPIAKDGQED